MAVIGSTMLDLIDLYKRQGVNGEMLPIIEMLNKMNPILEDALMVECNKGTRHLTTVRTGLPTVTWGMLYKGIPQSKSGTAQVEDTTGFAEGLSTVDERLLQFGNEAAVRLSEATAFLEAMSQEMATQIFYGNTATAPEKILGLAPRFGSLTAANGGQIVDAGGTGSDNTSVWFIVWGETTAHLLYPKGTPAGIERKDMGTQRVLDASNNPYFAKEEKFTQHMGVSVRNWKYVVRIANIDVSNMQAGSVALYNFMRRAYYRLDQRRMSAGRAAIYANRDVLEALDTLATNAGSSDSFIRLKTTQIEGREITTYRGIPVRETDAILNTEARVV